MNRELTFSRKKVDKAKDKSVRSLGPSTDCYGSPKSNYRTRKYDSKAEQALWAPPDSQQDPQYDSNVRVNAQGQASQPRSQAASIQARAPPGLQHHPQHDHNAQANTPDEAYQPQNYATRHQVHVPPDPQRHPSLGSYAQSDNRGQAYQLRNQVANNQTQAPPNPQLYPPHNSNAQAQATLTVLSSIPRALISKMSGSIVRSGILPIPINYQLTIRSLYLNNQARRFMQDFSNVKQPQRVDSGLHLQSKALLLGQHANPLGPKAQTHASGVKSFLEGITQI